MGDYIFKLPNGEQPVDPSLEAKFLNKLLLATLKLPTLEKPYILTSDFK